MRPVKEKLLYDSRNVVWKRVQNEIRFEVWGQISRGMNEAVNLVWIRTSTHTQDKIQ